MASPLYIAQNGTYEEFLEVYDPDGNDATEMLLAGLINRDPEAREKISNDMLDRGADPTVVDYGNNTVSLLLSNDEYGERGGTAAKAYRRLCRRKPPHQPR